MPKKSPICPLSFDADDATVLRQCIDYYHDALSTSPEAQAFLERRALDHPDAVSTFRLGFANRTLGLTLPLKQAKEGAAIRAQLARVGIYRDSGHEHLNGSLVIPILDPVGRVLQAYGRKVNDKLRAGTPKHLLLPGEPRGIWNSEALKGEELILAATLIDALTFWCAGHRNVTASLIPGTLHANLSAAIVKHVRRVVIAFPDRDVAAGDLIAAQLVSQGIEVHRAMFPPGMDANDCARKLPGRLESLSAILRRAEWVAGLPTSEPVAIAVDVLEQPQGHVFGVVPEGAGTAATGEHEALFTFEDRRYRVRGLDRCGGFDALRVNLMASRGDAFHMDTLDLYSAKARAGFTTFAAMELRVVEDVVKGDLGKLLLRLEALLDERRAREEGPKAIAKVEMALEARRTALALLTAPDLMDRIAADFEAVGTVGDSVNKLVGYLAAISRKLTRPLGLVIQSASAAGKSSLMNAVLAFVPEEDRVQFSAMTGQSLYYMGEASLKHRILALAEEEGASRAAYALKLLQSEGELTIASTGKDAKTGALIAQEYRVEGPVALFMTTTAPEVEAELQNRCLVLTVDESREATREIHRRQRARRTLAGLVAEGERRAILELHRNAQRLLRPLAVVNPWAESLTFPDGLTRLRRDHEKYLTLIEAVALLHQHQRPVQTATVNGQALDYVEVTPDDIRIANTLAAAVLGRSLGELPPQSRKLLSLITQTMGERFSRRDLRAAIGWGDTQLKVHLARLVDLEFLVAHRNPPGRRFTYERVAFVETDADPFPGLIDPAAFVQRSGSDADRSGAGRASVGARSGDGRGSESEGSHEPVTGNATESAKSPATRVTTLD